MTPDPPHPTWTRLQAELRQRVPESTFDVWLAPLRCGGVDGASVVVLAPSEVHNWVEQRFASVLRDAARAVLGPSATVALRAAGDQTAAGDGAHPGPGATRGAAPAVPADDPRAALFADTEASPLNPKFTFEQFVIGDANRFAHAAALAVAENPGNAYNPLFVVGPPGVGKTHLLHSIGNYVRAYGGGLTVRYTTVERFTNEFLEALKTRDVDAFKHRYRRNDVLLIDDVQFLESKVKTEEEFFHTFNALHETGSQLVLTSDRPPRDIEKLDERLRQRFGSGLVVDIRQPDPATRVTVLRKRAHHDGIDVGDDGVLELIAERVTDNVRGLEAALIRVVAYASLTGRAIDRALADDVLTQLYGRAAARAAAGPPTVERIQELVAETFDVTREELLGAGRTARVAWPRQVAMYLAREHTHETLPAIGRHFGGRDHSTVLHACKRAADRIGTDPDAFDAVASITARLTEPAV
ncbi:MAG TPA: chromosomal replication initiator protein DnaA [Baekduia sp.]|uniref:chromosomal replication initiator protein DnaA n=1 Tax=Baekduia sp. TaxID=2600305 RepID=UPI002D78A160|nr:chromosomal replication initiator protein DnaA [Baekduia sp.]HET6508815.1 chromosomal replication initiator protein DnaA [Baekduia sp.]